MINRDSTKEMESIWSDTNKYQKWLDVEIAVCEAWRHYGFIPKKSYLRIKKDSKFNVKEIDKLEKVIKHDVIAFTTNLAKSIGEDSRFVHLGLTSSDILDTSLSLLLVESGNLIKKEINKTVRILTKLSKRYIKTPIMGRSHGIHA